jgi:hypothetical protein
MDPSIESDKKGFRTCCVGKCYNSLLSRDTCLLRAEFDVEERRKNDLPKLVLRSITEG